MDNKLPDRKHIEDTIIKVERVVANGKPKVKRTTTKTTMHKEIGKPNINIKRKRIAKKASDAATSALANFKREHGIEMHKDLGM